MKEGINVGVKKVLSYLEDKATKVSKNKIEQVATISANNDNNLGKLISKAFNSVVVMDRDWETLVALSSK